MATPFLNAWLGHNGHKGAKPIQGGLSAAKAFSGASYIDPSKRPKNINNFVLDEELSNQRNVVYSDPNTGRVVVAFRGTDFSDRYDVGQDVLIATGTFAGASRVQKGKDVVRQAADKYGVDPKQVELTGHSLGGRIAQAVGKQLGSHRVSAINPGSSPIDLVLPSAGSGYGRTFTTGTDPISISNTLANPSSVRYNLQQTIEPHGLGAFGGSGVEEEP